MGKIHYFYALLDTSGQPALINGLANDLGETELDFSLFKDEEHAQDVKWMTVPACGEGCCTRMPYADLRVARVRVVIDIVEVL